MDHPQNNRVLIVDDQREIHDDFDEMLGAEVGRSTDALAAAFVDAAEDRPRASFELHHAASGEAAVDLVDQARASSSPIAAAFVDIRMPPGIDGIETVRRIRRIDSRIEIVIMTAYTEQRFSEVIQHMDLLHNLLYIRKPFAREEIQQIALVLVHKWNVEHSLDACRDQLARADTRLRALLRASQDALATFDADDEGAASNHFDELRALAHDLASEVDGEAT